jgi:hypothetical protein
MIYLHDKEEVKMIYLHDKEEVKMIPLSPPPPSHKNINKQNKVRARLEGKTKAISLKEWSYAVWLEESMYVALVVSLLTFSTALMAFGACMQESRSNRFSSGLLISV